MSDDRHLRILAFEPYDAGSHRAVRESISRHSRHEWTWLTRPGRAWKWRMRIGALEMLQQAGAAGAFDRPIDLIFATSLLSLSDLIAGLPPPLRGTPTMLYMHENQIAYPRGDEPGESGGGEDSAAGDERSYSTGRRGGGTGPETSGAAELDPGGDSGVDHHEGLISGGLTSGGGRDVHFALTNLTSILSADRVIFNSE